MQTPIITRPLTDAEMQRIVTAIDEAATPIDSLIAAAFGTFNALLADASLTIDHYSREAPLDGRNLKIPKEQWVQIGEALKAKEDTSLGGTNMLLDWMNLGPSSYEVTA